MFVGAEAERLDLVEVGGAAEFAEELLEPVLESVPFFVLETELFDRFFNDGAALLRRSISGAASSRSVGGSRAASWVLSWLMVVRKVLMVCSPIRQSS